MNRRTFIKLTGITTIATIIPAIARLELKPKWINASDQLPIAQQRIIQLSKNPMYCGDYTLIVGKYQDNTRLKMFNKQVKFSISQEHRFSEANGRVRWNYPKTNDEEVRELEWVKAEDVRNVPHSVNVSLDLEHLYWMPVGKQLPKSLPPFPQCVSWSKFLYKQPKHDDYIEVKDQDGYIEKAYVKQLKTLPNEPDKFCLWLEKDYDKGHCKVIDINEKYWAWRHFSLLT